MSMAGLGTKEEVLRLATIYRTEKKIEPNWRGRSRNRTLYEPSNELNFGDLSQRILTDGPNAQLVEEDSFEVNRWNKAFQQLRPPMGKYKRKTAIEKNKFLSRSCEEIIECIRPFTMIFEEGQQEGRETKDVTQYQNENTGMAQIMADENIMFGYSLTMKTCSVKPSVI